MRIDRYWYGLGHCKFYQLEFRNCEFDSIENGAFDHEAFKEITSLIFKSNVRPLHLHSGILHGLSLSNIEFLHSPIASMAYDFLWPIRHKLTNIVSKASLDDAKTFMHLLAGIGLPQVRSVCIQNSTASNVLHYRSLFGVQNITSIEISSSGLQSIEERTFDHVSKTLTMLNLDNNLLMTLPNTIYDELLKSKSIASVIMERNPWRCDCHLSLLIGKIESNDGFHMSVHTRFPPNCDAYAKNRVNRCSTVTNVTLSDMPTCMDLYGTNFLNIKFPKFIVAQIAESDELVYKMVEQKNGPISYVSIHATIVRHGRPPSVGARGNRDPVLCILHRQDRMRMTISHPDLMKIVCILDHSNQTAVWPLNCRTFRFDFQGEPSSVWLGKEDMHWMCLIFIFIYSVAIFIGMIGGYFVVVLSPKILKGHERVVITKDRARGKIKAGYTVFVMPDGWINPRRNML